MRKRGSDGSLMPGWDGGAWQHGGSWGKNGWYSVSTWHSSGKPGDDGKWGSYGKWNDGKWDNDCGDDGNDFGIDDGDTSPKHGVAIEIVCGCVPVLELDTASVFHENVSMMLQSALSSGGKVESLFEYCEDRDILDECRRIGHRKVDVLVAKLKRGKVRAVGTTGKRSIVLALVVGLLLGKGDFHEFWEMLKIYELSSKFMDVLRHGKAAMSGASTRGQPAVPNLLPANQRQALQSPKAKATLDTQASASESRQEDSTQGVHQAMSKDHVDSVASDDPDDDGLDITIVCQNVPVVTLGKMSVFQESASSLLQAALSSESKADALYEYCNDKEILTECGGLGFQKEELFIARFRQLKDVKAVGTTGKRSTMIALIVALVLQDKISDQTLMKAVRDYDRTLEKPFLELIHSAINPDKAADAAPAAKRARVNKRCGAPSAEELKARIERMQRFEAAAAKASRFDGEVQKALSTDEKPLEGSCMEVEKPYFRLTTLPLPNDVRPEHVLKQAFSLVRAKWSENRDWIYTSEMLRSIRQDLTVQMLQGAFVIEVCEFGAKAAIEQGDIKQFDQFTVQLEQLYADAEAAEAPNALEFLTFRLLYLTVCGDSLALAMFLQRHTGRISAAVSAGDSRLMFARRSRAALVMGNCSRLAKLVEQVWAAGSSGSEVHPTLGEAGGIAQRLSAMLLESARLRQVSAVCKGVKPSVSRQLLSRAVHADLGTLEDQVLASLPVVFVEGDPNRVDREATGAATDKLLACGARLGEQSSAHRKCFVRANGSG